MIHIQEFEAKTTERYLTDPEFYARVQVAVELASTSMRRATGAGPGLEFLAGMVQMAAYGLMMAEVDVTANVDDELIASMRRTAEQLGFQLIKGEKPA